jgi:hypothetical protein
MVMFNVSRVPVRGALVSVLLALGGAFPAAAAVLDISYFDGGQKAQAQSALTAFQSGMSGMRTETFEGYQAWNGTSGANNPGATNVGAFSSLGGVGNGGSAINGGSHLQVRSDDPWTWGRFNTSGVDGNWLDSNDTYGMRWDVSGTKKFNSIGFLLTDVADVGGIFSIKVGGKLYSQQIGADGKMANGSIQLVRILLPKAVKSTVIELSHDRLNDGFGIDGATIGRVAPVPLPPAALLLASGAAALFGLRRRRRAA